MASPQFTMLTVLLIRSKVDGGEAQMAWLTIARCTKGHECVVGYTGGCHEIGGNCIEIEAMGQRIVLDIGLPLQNETGVQLPDISGLASADDSLLAVVT